MPKLVEGCVKPAGGPVMPEPEEGTAAQQAPSQEVKMQARVGKPAIDFEATAWIAGQGFAPVKLSDYKGKWIVICFYPGDFTFV